MNLTAILMQKLGDFWAKHPEITAIDIRRNDTDFFPPRIMVECRVGEKRFGAVCTESPGSLGLHFDAASVIAMLERELAKVNS